MPGSASSSSAPHTSQVYMEATLRASTRAPAPSESTATRRC
jgi:hypothetical protein